MKRGPKPAPTTLRVLRGDRKDRINFDEPVPADGLPVCPEGASRETRKIWDETVRELDTMGLVTGADRDNLFAYCQAVAMHREASALLDKEGILLEGKMGGWVKHPAVQIQRDAATLIRQLGSEFGLTPSSRSTMRTTPVNKRNEQGAARLLSS